jgi:Na+/phosphate symporter
MADDVTLEDLQQVNKRLAKLEADLKEAQRLHGILDTFVTDINKNFVDHIKDNQTNFTNLTKRVGELEKQIKKK